MKKLQKLSLIPLLLAGSLSQPIDVQAAEEQGVANLNLQNERGACLITLSGQNPHEAEQTLQKELALEEVQGRLEALDLAYQELNAEIYQLENEGETSLASAQAQMDVLLEELYDWYWHNDENFPNLHPDEQLQLIEQDEQVQSWQTYLQEIEQLIHERVAERDIIKKDYDQAVYEYENLLSEPLDETSPFDSEYNQCLLYPYSVEHIPAEQILIDQDTLPLENYLVQIDQYLSKLVPQAYHQVRFEDIYASYQRAVAQTADEELIPYEGESAYLTDEAIEKLSFKEKLTLTDVEKQAQRAAKLYQGNRQIELVEDAFLQLIEVKEKQFAYFYEINAASFGKIQDHLVNYLNEHQLNDDASIQQVQQLHRRYQMKLVFLNEDGSWRVNDSYGSGFSEDMSGKDFSLTDDADLALEEVGPKGESGDLDEIAASLGEEDDDFISKPQARHLDYLKNRLNRPKERTDIKDLPKPKNKDTLAAMASDSSDSSQPKGQGKGSISLPDTGETRIFTYLGLGIIIIGCILLLVNLRLRRKERETKDDIDLL